MTLLQDRINDLIKDYTEEHGTFNSAELGRKCKLGRASISEWRGGRTKSIQAKYIFCVAKYFSGKKGEINPDWINTGRGSKYLEKKDSSIINNTTLEYAISIIDSEMKETNIELGNDIKAQYIAELYLRISNNNNTTVEIDFLLELSKKVRRWIWELEKKELLR